MTYSVDHKLLTVHGDLFTGAAEHFTFGVRIVGGTLPPTQAMVDALQIPFQTFWQSQAAAGLNSPLRYLKLAHIDASGLYPPGHVPLEYVWASTGYFPPGTSAIGLPAQISQVATLTTAFPRGLASKGRIYLPQPQAAVGADGRWTTGIALATANAVKVLINAINAVSGMGTVHVMSKIGSGATHPVTGIAVGRVPDTQRRRRRSLVEDRQSVVL